MLLRAVLAAAAALVAAVAAQEARCGRQAGNIACANSQCCSYLGYCGNSETHCGVGCQRLFGSCDRQSAVAAAAAAAAAAPAAPASAESSATNGFAATSLVGQALTAVDPRCGRQGGGAVCPKGLCCSSLGFCNNTPAHCGTGCQSPFGRCGTTSAANPPPVSAGADPRCGAAAGGVSCINNACCSFAGFCNTTPQHCGTGCQKLFGRCDSTSPSPSPAPSNGGSNAGPDPRCGAAAGGVSCANNACCSSAGFCNTTPQHCGAGCQKLFGRCDSTSPSPSPSPSNGGSGASGGGSNARCGPQGGNASCGNGLCCSFLGFCGQTEVHCGLQCQLLFGRCGLGPLPPPAPVGSFPTPDPAKAARYITGCNKGGVFALTFDDGPSVNIGLILDILKRNNIKATFFINGKNRGDLNVAKDKANLKRAFDEGHQIGSHTLSHIDISTTNETLLFPQMKVNDDLIKAVIGKRPVYMRPPFGSVNQRALTALGTWGYKVIGWNLDSKDFEHIGKPDFIQLGEDNYQADLLRISAVLPKTSLMTLQHDYVPEDSQAGGWVQHVIDKFKNLGYKFVTAGECLGDSPANWYRD